MSVLRSATVVLAGTLMCTSARAQHATAVAPQPAPPAAQDQAAIPVALESEGIPVEAASKNQVEAALKQYRLGVDLMTANRYGEALELFVSSYQKVNSPNSRLMVARVLAKLGRYPEAYVELNGVIADASKLAAGLSKYEKTVEAARVELADVATKVALVKLNVDGQLQVAGAVVPRSRWDEVVPLNAGPVRVVYQLKNGQRVERVTELKNGEINSIDLALPALEATARPQTLAAPAPESRGEAGVSYSTLGWVSAGAGLVGFASFAAFGLLNQSQFEKLEDACPAGRCPASREEDAEAGRTFQTFANVGLGVGLVGALAATYFWVFTSDAREPESELLQRRSNVGPGTTRVRIGLGSAALEGRF